ncbi:hypothetical protein ACJIZ3_015908 [Penstemon smallii]|uniref:Uncharacterized protein n=1 Tax=Penstemon smallii TaxID=265156 RepID=A0ABD3RNU7_9LAMI
MTTHQQTITHEPPPLAPLSNPKRLRTTTTTYSTHLASAANLANLLPTGTVLAFQTLTPLFSNKGMCHLSNKILTSSLIAFCALICFLSSFTDSFVDSDDGKLYYGIATFKGLYIFNKDEDKNCDEERLEVEEGKNDLSKFRISLIDFVHACVSLLVFLTFAFSDNDVQNCFFPFGGTNLDVLVMNLPLAAGIFASFLFVIFPTTRKGIGYADMPTKSK